MPASNRILCGCPVPALAIVDATLTVQGDNNKTFQVAIAKNGTIESESVETIKIGSSGDSVSVSLHADFSQSSGDYTEVWIRNTTDATDPTVSGFYLRIVAWAL